MKSSGPAADRETLATLRMMCEQLDVTRLSTEDRETVGKWWATFEEPKPTEVSFGGSLSGLVFPVFDPGDLDPHLAPCALAIRVCASAIESGLPGAEHVAEELLRKCGFDDDAAKEILREMISRAPPPDPEALN